MSQTQTQAAIVGAGPIGLETAIALKQEGIEYEHFEAGQVGQTFTWFPKLMRFFSSPDRMAIAGVPIPRVDESKVSREEWMAYLRAIAQQFDLKVRTYEPVTGVERHESGGFVLHSKDLHGAEHECRAGKIILAVGDMHQAHRLGMEGEDLPWVRHYLDETHDFFRQRVIVVGGRNSAVEAALRCWGVGADVTLCCRSEELEEESIKYWLLPELRGRIRRGEIRAYFGVEPTGIRPEGKVVFNHVGHREHEKPVELDTDFLLLMVGYEADPWIFKELGVNLRGPEESTEHDESTMETNVPGVYVAGTATAGTQQRYTVFIETCHVHARRIAAHIAGKPAPREQAPKDMAEN